MENWPKTNVPLQDPMSMYLLWIILAGVLLALVIFLQIFFRKRYKGLLHKKKKKIKVKQPKKRKLVAIKADYIGRMNRLNDGVSKGTIPVKTAYQQLSSIIRGFCAEATGIDVDKCTLAEIQRLRWDFLSDLVAEYYAPEFAENAPSNLRSSIYKTWQTISNWR